MASSLRVAVSAHWAGGEADCAAALAIEGLRATSGRPEGSVAWLMLLEQLAQPVVEEARVARESARETPRKDGGRLPALRLERLAPLAPCLALLPASHFCSDPASASAVTYWKLALWLGAATGALDDTGHALARCITSGAPPESAPLTSPVPTPTAAGAVPDRIIVSGAGCIAADGVYTRSGEFQGVARFIHQVGQLWLIRYRFPNGSNCKPYRDPNRPTPTLPAPLALPLLPCFSCVPSFPPCPHPQRQPSAPPPCPYACRPLATPSSPLLPPASLHPLPECLQGGT